MVWNDSRHGWGLIAVLSVLALSCGESIIERPGPSGSAMVRASSPDGANTSPHIQSVRFVPPSALPGQRLVAVVVASDPDNDPIALNYQWHVGGRRLIAEGSEIIVPAAQKGTPVSVSVVASDGLGESLPSEIMTRIANRSPRITELEIETVEVSEGMSRGPHWEVHPTVVDPDGDPTSFRFEWIINGEVSSTTEGRFAKSHVRRGDEVRVRVIAFDGDSESVPLESASIRIGNAAPEISSTPPGLDSGGLFVYRPTVFDRDHDTVFHFQLLESPEGMTLDEETGAVTWRPGFHQAGTHRVKLEVADALGARSRQVFEVQVQVQVGGKQRPASMR